MRKRIYLLVLAPLALVGCATSRRRDNYDNYTGGDTSRSNPRGDSDQDSTSRSS